MRYYQPGNSSSVHAKTLQHEHRFFLSYAPPRRVCYEGGRDAVGRAGVVVRIPSLVHIQSAFIRHTSLSIPMPAA